MSEKFLFYPEQASTVASHVDAIFFALLGISLFFSAIIFLLIVVFAIKYKRRKETAPLEHHKAEHSALGTAMEITWTVIPFVIGIAIFWWSADVFIKMYSPAPENALNIFVVGKQWMWKFEHPDGRREINELHIPVGQPVRLLMISQDVIHDVFVPDFRMKHDVIPMRYTTQWFTPTRTGKFHIFCAQYCGNQHSEMVGWVHVMPENEYEAWLSGGTGISQPQAQGSPADLGKDLMQGLACFSCHRNDAMAMAPHFEGLFGSKVKLTSGQSVTADENYIRESILNPAAKIVNGFQNIMPSFQGRVSEEQVNQIISYIKSLGKSQ